MEPEGSLPHSEEPATITKMFMIKINTEIPARIYAFFLTAWS